MTLASPELFDGLALGGARGYTSEAHQGQFCAGARLTLGRVWEMPNKYTFKMKAVAALLAEEMQGLWVDPFCGKHSPASVRNDADGSNDAEYHMDGLDFLKSRNEASCDGVLFDPPYSVEQALRKYKPRQNGTAGRAEYWARCKDEITRIVRKGGKAICFGWDSTGIGKKRGFLLQRVLLMCHGACHNDTIITVETHWSGSSAPLRYNGRTQPPAELHQ